MLLWIMVGAQMVAWGWFSLKGGDLPGKKFFIFTIGMLLGQLGAGIEAYQLQAWRGFTVQAYFFVTTVFGVIQRYRQMKRERAA